MSLPIWIRQVPLYRVRDWIAMGDRLDISILARVSSAISTPIGTIAILIEPASDLISEFP